MFKIFSIFRHDIIWINFFLIFKFIKWVWKIICSRWILFFRSFTQQEKSFVYYRRNVIVWITKHIHFFILLNFFKSFYFSPQHLVIERNFNYSFIICIFNVCTIINQTKRTLIYFLSYFKFIINNLTFNFTLKHINFSL